MATSSHEQRPPFEFECLEFLISSIVQQLDTLLVQLANTIDLALSRFLKVGASALELPLIRSLRYVG